jgi:hypothetical protein
MKTIRKIPISEDLVAFPALPRHCSKQPRGASGRASEAEMHRGQRSLHEQVELKGKKIVVVVSCMIAQKHQSVRG